MLMLWLRTRKPRISWSRAVDDVTCMHLMILNQRFFFSNRHRSASEQIWHWQLGYPQLKVVQFLHKSNCISIASWNKNKFICDSCQIGKSCWLPFISTRDCSTIILIWGYLFQLHLMMGIVIMLFLLMNTHD